jgi:FAD:protein FMN transferase
MKLPSNLLRRARPCLGTLVDVTLLETEASLAHAAFELAFAAVDRVQQLMSAHDPASDTCRLSAAAHRQAVHVHPHTLAVLRLAQQIHTASGGIFDITIGRTMAQAGHIPRVEIEELSDQASSQDIVIESQADTHATVRFKRPLHLDLGGIAKGYAVDCAVLALQSCGVVSGLVNAGGDMRAFGPQAHPVQLRSARGARTVAMLQDAALATSCNADVPTELASPHADARSHQLVRQPHSVVVHAPSAAVADALTKVAMVCPQTATRMCAEFQAEWRAVDYF